MMLSRLFSPVLLLRIAATLVLLHFVGHSIGMMQGPSHGEEEVAVLNTMRSHTFNTMGSQRSYMDFFLGFGWDASINMAMQVLLLCLLAGVAKTEPATVRPFVAVFAFSWIAVVLLYLKFFFIAPVVFAILMVVVLAAAWFAAGQRKQVPAQHFEDRRSTKE